METVFFWSGVIILKGGNAFSNSCPLPGGEFSYRVGTGTSVRAPNMTACCSRTKAMKGLSRKSTSPTSTLDASASRGNFFMNLFFSCVRKRGRKRKLSLVRHTNKIYPVFTDISSLVRIHHWLMCIIPTESTEIQMLGSSAPEEQCRYWCLEPRRC